MKTIFHSLIVLVLIHFTAGEILAQVPPNGGIGKADLIWRNSNNGATAVWLMNQAGLRETATFPGGAPLQWVIQDVGDVNSDGSVDFVWRNTTSGATALWLMNAAGLRDGATFPGGAGMEWVIKGVRDVNGDGHADLVWRNTNNGSTAVWLMNATGLRDSATFPGGAPLEWVIQGVADVNGDGFGDLVWRNSDSGATAVWLMNAAGLRDGATFPGGAGMEWVIKEVHDVDDDGYADLVWRNTNTGSTAVWLMNADGLRESATFPGGAPLEWVIQGVGDINGNGPADLVWRDSNSGATAVWLMNTSGLLQEATFPGGAGPEWIIQAIGNVGEPITDPNDIDDDGDGFTENQGDCDDTKPGINPDALEIPGNGIDEDCDGQDAPAPKTARENFFACNMVEADNQLQAELDAEPSNQQAHFFRAMTRLFRMVEETEDGPTPGVFTDSLKEILDRFAFTPEGRSVCDFTSNPPKNAEGDPLLPENSPNGQEVATFLENVALPAVMASIEENVQVIDSGFGFVVTSEELTSIGIKNEGPVEIDYGEVKLLEAGLFGLKGALLVALAYDLNVDIDDVHNRLDTIDFQNEVIDANPSLLTLKEGKNPFFSQARTALSSGVDAYLAASAFIRAETDDQDNDFVSIEPEDLRDEENLRAQLEEAKASLSGPSVIEEELTDFSGFIDTPFDLRGLVPPIKRNANGDPIFEAGSFPDPTFNGILPNMTQERLTDTLDLPAPEE